MRPGSWGTDPSRAQRRPPPPRPWHPRPPARPILTRECDHPRVCPSVAAAAREKPGRSEARRRGRRCYIGRRLQSRRDTSDRPPAPPAAGSLQRPGADQLTLQEFCGLTGGEELGSYYLRRTGRPQSQRCWSRGHQKLCRQKRKESSEDLRQQTAGKTILPSLLEHSRMEHSLIL